MIWRTICGKFYEDESHEHMVFPGMVYISHPTEYGTLYSRKELEEISGICRKYEMPLYLDGARLGYGLMSRQTDVTLQDIARYCDVFYIGGTKVGALCGEAVVFSGRKRSEIFHDHGQAAGRHAGQGTTSGEFSLMNCLQTICICSLADRASRRRRE